MIIIRIDPQTNKVSYDEPLGDTLVFQAPTYRAAVAAAIECLQSFGAIMDEQGIVNFDMPQK